MKLTITNLKKTFTRADETIELFHDFGMTLAAGEAVTVLGPSGSGKTTLLRMIAMKVMDESIVAKIDMPATYHGMRLPPRT